MLATLALALARAMAYPGLASHRHRKSHGASQEAGGHGSGEARAHSSVRALMHAQGVAASWVKRTRKMAPLQGCSHGPWIEQFWAKLSARAARLIPTPLRIINHNIAVVLTPLPPRP